MMDNIVLNRPYVRNGVVYRHVRGSYSDTDIVLEMRTCDWIRPSYYDIGYITEHLYANEDRLYPPPYKGGDFLVEYLVAIRRHGYEYATAQFLDRYKHE